MADYKKMYLTMFRAVEKVICYLEANLNNLDPDVLQCIHWLIQAQQESEEIYITTTDEKNSP